MKRKYVKGGQNSSIYNQEKLDEEDQEIGDTKDELKDVEENPPTVEEIKKIIGSLKKKKSRTRNNK